MTQSIQVDTSPIPAPEVIVVKVPGWGPADLHVGATNGLAPGVKGLWIQTGLGANGTGVTFWIEDGT